MSARRRLKRVPCTVADIATREFVDVAAAERLPRAPDAAEIPLATLRERGVIAIDKPAGPTSHDVVEKVKRTLRTSKAGHGGTLDPAVTGVLVVGLGQATRLLRLQLAAGKTYDTVLRLHADVDRARVEEVLRSQVGTITQLPPVRSRVKRVERERDIYAIELAPADAATPRDIRFVVTCEAGTYIRKLCHDVGEALGIGAHMAELRRTAAGGYAVGEAIALPDLREAMDRATLKIGDEPLDEAPLRARLHTVENMLERIDVPAVWIDPGATTPVASGAELAVPGVTQLEDGIDVDDDVAVLTSEGWLVTIGIARMTSRDIACQPRGLAIRPNTTVWPPPNLGTTDTGLGR